MSLPYAVDPSAVTYAMSIEVLPTPASPRHTMRVFTSLRGDELPPAARGLPGGEFDGGDGGSLPPPTVGRRIFVSVKRRRIDMTGGRCAEGQREDEAHGGMLSSASAALLMEIVCGGDRVAGRRCARNAATAAAAR